MGRPTIASSPRTGRCTSSGSRARGPSPRHSRSAPPTCREAAFRAAERRIFLHASASDASLASGSAHGTRMALPAMSRSLYAVAMAAVLAALSTAARAQSELQEWLDPKLGEAKARAEYKYTVYP